MRMVNDFGANALAFEDNDGAIGIKVTTSSTRYMFRMSERELKALKDITTHA